VSTNVVTVSADFAAQVNKLSAESGIGTAKPEIVAGPDQNGEFPAPLAGALWMAIVHGKRQLPLNGKIALLKEWEKHASSDPEQIRKWATEYLGCNFGSVADDGPIFEVDSLEVRKRFGQAFSQTLTVQSSEQKGHRYYQPADVEHIAQNATEYGDFSLRKHNAYCVSPGSVHPRTGNQYRVAINVPMVVPTAQEIAFWNSERKADKKTGHAELDDETPIAEGSRNTALASILGKARQALGMDKEQLFVYGLSVNEKRCRPPLPESEVRTIANSIGRYEVKPSGPESVILGSQQAAPAPAVIEVPKLNRVPYPVFPEWVMHGTSLYEGFVKPVCEQNCRIPYFMFLPAAALMMNYLALKVSVENKQLIPSFFMVLIGEKGRAIKSSSVEDAIEYLDTAGVLKSGQGTRNAEGKSLVWTAGSTEGLGLEMARTNCKNAVLFYDELSTLTSKAEIDSSSLKSHLLSLYESGKYSNTVKSKKETFNFDPRTYCASLIACTTDEVFEDKWSGLTGKSTGLDDRFIFLLQPKELPELTPHVKVNTVAGAAETHRRIDKAVQREVYSIDDTTPLEKEIGVLGNRAEVRAEKWALYFAVDLGRDSIDDGCIERGLAIARYEKAVKKYLGSPEAETKIAAAQIKYRRILERKFDGRATEREMERAMNYTRYGTDGWWRIVDGGLVRAGIIGKTISDGKPSVCVIKPLEE
jgi:hypothetical protein